MLTGQEVKYIHLLLPNMKRNNPIYASKNAINIHHKIKLKHISTKKNTDLVKCCIIRDKTKIQLYS